MSALLTLALLGHASAQAQLLDPFDKSGALMASLEEASARGGFETRGVLSASQSSEIGAGMSARLIALPFKEGQSFSRGALLARFDCARLEAEAEALGHAKTALSTKLDNVRELLAAGAAGALEESMAAADLARAAADEKVAAARLTDCAVYAPYAGIVKTRHVSPYDTPALNAPLLSILRSGAIEVTLIAPSAWLRWLKPKAGFEFLVDETGETLKGRVERLGAAVDPVSQTIEVIATFPAGTGTARHGMSGVARFDPPKNDRS